MPASFDLAALAAATPVVRLRSAYAKNRKQAELPLSPELADVLRGYLTGKPADASVWPGTWPTDAAEMIRRDLAAARQTWLSGFQDARQRAEAEQSDFPVAYVDAEGRYADFHSLRHLFISRVVRSGVTPKVAQELARHSTVSLTLGRYAHAGLYDLSAAVDALPPLLPAGPDAATLAATGTDI